MTADELNKAIEAYVKARRDHRRLPSEQEADYADFMAWLSQKYILVSIEQVETEYEEAFESARSVKEDIRWFGAGQLAALENLFPEKYVVI